MAFRVSYGSCRSSQDEHHELTLTPELISKIVRYVQDYGRGGFQGRLDTVLEELTELGNVLQPLTVAS